MTCTDKNENGLPQPPLPLRGIPPVYGGEGLDGLRPPPHVSGQELPAPISSLGRGLRPRLAARDAGQCAAYPQGADRLGAQGAEISLSLIHMGRGAQFPPHRYQAKDQCYQVKRTDMSLRAARRARSNLLLPNSTPNRLAHHTPLAGRGQVSRATESYLQCRGGFVRPRGASRPARGTS